MYAQDPIVKHFRLNDVHARALTRLGLHTIRDLLYHFPTRYERPGDHTTIAGIVPGQTAILYGTIRKPEARKSWKSRRPMSEAWLEDGTGKIKLMWFNQPYIAKMFTEGTMAKVSGRVEGTTSHYIANPEVERVTALPIGGLDTVFVQTDDTAESAVYSETMGVTSRWFRHGITKIFQEGIPEDLHDPIPDDVRTRYHLPTIPDALVRIHQPKNERDAIVARKRFAFEEVFIIQIARGLDRAQAEQARSIPIVDGETRTKDFLKHLPFALTRGQTEAVSAILSDMAHPPAMGRLLEGDVGSGKTAIAATTAYAVVTATPQGRPSATLQVAYMAPTEILAEQHFASFCELFVHFPVTIGLITGTTCKKFPSKTDASSATRISRALLLKQTERGEISILIGTHALVYEQVRFRDLAYAIIDEQHRFGTNQRRRFVRKDGAMPHLLSMTATPIPRTLALTLYGDLDLTVLTDMPPGRKPIITHVVQKTGRVSMYQTVQRELDAGRQAYVICPRIDEPDPTKEMALQTRSVLAEADRLKRQELKKYRIAVLHGQMKPREKEEVMRTFLAHEADVLVATSVVEVGVNVPNATVIVIEGAERFGLAQLHQLRGRVVRSNHQAYCFALTSEGGSTSRLRAFEKAKNGFVLAEMDLKIRGPGELYGRSQSGLTDLGMEALKNIKMVEAARTEARRIVAEDPTLHEYPTLAQAVETQRGKLHFE